MTILALRCSACRKLVKAQPREIDRTCPFCGEGRLVEIVTVEGLAKAMAAAEVASP